MAKQVKVRAIFKRPEDFGFYGGRVRRKGDTFDVDEDKIGSWMERVEEPKKPRKTRSFSQETSDE